MEYNEEKKGSDWTRALLGFQLYFVLFLAAPWEDIVAQQTPAATVRCRRRRGIYLINVTMTIWDVISPVSEVNSYVGAPNDYSARISFAWFDDPRSVLKSVLSVVARPPRAPGHQRK